MQNSKDVRDRTEEFFHTVETLRRLAVPSQGNQFNDNVPNHSDRNNIQVPEDSGSAELTQAASEISNNISDIEKNLKTLKQLAAKQSLFNDPIQEINRVTMLIKQSIAQREGEIKLLAAMLTERTEHTQQQQRSYTAIIDNLKSGLARNTKVFTEILQLRNKNLKQQNTRRKNFEADSGQGLRKRTAPLNFGQLPDNRNGDEEFSQEQHTLQMDADEVKYHKGRAQAVENIETTINELGTMYTRLVHLVAAQGDTVIRIDTNLEGAVANVEAGHGYLMKYYERVSGSQSLIIKIFAVIVVVCVLLIVMKS